MPRPAREHRAPAAKPQLDDPLGAANRLGIVLDDTDTVNGVHVGSAPVGKLRQPRQAHSKQPCHWSLPDCGLSPPSHPAIICAEIVQCLAHHGNRNGLGEVPTCATAGCFSALTTVSRPFTTFMMVAVPSSAEDLFVPASASSASPCSEKLAVYRRDIANYNDPFVDGTRPAMRGSNATAARSARPNALNRVSA